MRIRALFLLIHLSFYSQTVTLNEDFVYNTLRDKQLKGEFRSDISFTIRPIESDLVSEITHNLYSTILSNKSKSLSLKNLPININFEFNSKHPYNRNNGSMIPNRGLQTILSGGIFLKAGPLSIQLKPNTTLLKIKTLMVFGKDIILLYGRKDIDYGIRLIYPKDTVLKNFQDYC